MLLRHVGYVLVGAAAVVFLIEPTVFTGSTPLIARLSDADRADLYNQLIVVTASLLGFTVTAISILVLLDAKRKIVEELKRGESFKLLIVNMLAVVLLLFVLTLMGIAGSVLEADSASSLFERFYEWLMLAATIELAITGFFFGVVTYKVAAHG